MLKIIKSSLVQGTLLLLLLLLALLWQPLFTQRALLATDLIYELDPLWQEQAPAGFSRAANHALSDPVYLYYPWRYFTFQALSRGQVPLWNPHINGGVPFLGNGQTAVFEPFNLISQLFSLEKSFVVVAFLRLFVVGFFTLLYSRQIGLSRYGAFLAMVAFTFSGVELVNLTYLKTSAVAWLPAVLYLSEKIIRRDRGAYIPLLGLVIGFQFLAGHPATSIHLSLLFGGYCLYRVAGQFKGMVTLQLKLLGKLALAWLLGLMVGAVQLLPAAETILFSEVLAARRAAQPALISLFFPWGSWLTAILTILPDYFGNPIYDNYWYPGRQNYVELNVYAGILPLALFITVVFLVRRSGGLRASSGKARIIKFFIFLAIFSFGLALSLPLFNLINQLPILNIANNDRLRVIYVFAVAMTAGCGLDLLISSGLPGPNQRGSAPFSRSLARVVGAMAGVSLLIVLLSYLGLIVMKEQVIEFGQAQVAAAQGNPLFPRSPDYYRNLVEVRYRQMLANFHPQNYRMYLPVWLGAIYLILNRLFAISFYRAKIMGGAIIGLTIIDLFLIGQSFNPTIPNEQIYPVPEMVRFLKQEDPGLYRVIGLDLALYPNSAMLFGLDDVRGYEPVSSRRYMALISSLEGNVRAIHVSFFTQARAPLLDFLNVKYAFSRQPLSGKWERIYADDDQLALYRNQQVLPRAFLVHQAEYVADARRSLARVLDPAFNFRERVILEGPAPVRLPQETLASPPVEQVQITTYRPERIEIDVQTRPGGFLVLSDTYMPGWQAYVDGQPAEIRVANHAFRAVAIPAGHHHVEFIYDPLSYKVGLILTVSGLLIVGLSLLTRSIFE